MTNDNWQNNNKNNEVCVKTNTIEQIIIEIRLTIGWTLIKCLQIIIYDSEMCHRLKLYQVNA